MAICSRTLIGILYSACSLVVLMALNLTVYSFNKGAASSLELSKRSLGESELLGKWVRHKKGQNGMMCFLECNYSKILAFSVEAGGWVGGRLFWLRHILLSGSALQDSCVRHYQMKVIHLTSLKAKQKLLGHPLHLIEPIHNKWCFWPVHSIQS